MTKYFYTCPLQAAYMQKEFDLNIVDAFDVKLKWVEFGIGGYWTHSKKETDPMNTLYIAQDCLSLLEPQKDDIVDLGNHGIAIVTERSDNNINCALFDVTLGVWKDGYWHRRWHPILKRNGKPFFWPQKEE